MFEATISGYSTRAGVSTSSMSETRYRWSQENLLSMKFTLAIALDDSA